MDGLHWIRFIILILFISPSYCLRRQKRIVGGTAAAAPPEDDPIVFVNKFDRTARVYGARDPDKKFYAFRGIRFGEPPLGIKRFQRPKAVRLEGDYNATVWGPPCLQPSANDPYKIVGSEDCLFLNVFTPTLPEGNEGRPVLIWIHGGGFRRGSASQYDMRHLIQKNMVVVSIQYRLGSLGFLSTGMKDLPGNNGMFDMTLAVNWVKDYIEFFGGNPKNIVAFGHGTGASSAIMLSVSKFLRDRFSGLIAMSGTILSHFSVDRNPSSTAKYIALNNGCPTNDTIQMVRCLRELPADNLVKTDSKLSNTKMTVQGYISSITNILIPGPVIEGVDDERSLPNFITNTPEGSLKSYEFPEIPLLAGVMKDEADGAIFKNYQNEIQKNLKKNPNYITDEVIPKLQSVVPSLNNALQFVPQAFSKYLQIFQKGENTDNLKSIAGAIEDAIFNTPIFLTLQQWSQKAKSFLFSFDHKGKRNYGKDFLAGSPLVNSESNDITNYGDELGYIFDQNTIFGEPTTENNNQSEEDKEVTEVFTGLISDFARSGEINIGSQSNNNSLWSNDKSSYISVSSKLKSMENFRYCELGLWAGMTDRLQSPICSIFKTTLQMVNKVEDTAMKTQDLVVAPISQVGGVLGITSDTTNNQPKREQEEKLKSIPKIPKVPVISLG
ncbi:esterase E4-like [Prorops nasuta]|uniref:esterase E4-like n=1 Tax=Prorops nasuta TaxID=863751 RepID=UPI0034CF76FE